MIFIILVLLIIFFLILSAFFSGSETGIVSFNHFRLRHQLERGSRKARYIQDFLNDPENFLVTILTGNNLSNVCITALVTLLITKLGIREVSLYTTLLVTPAILIFGEVVPKAIFSSRADILVPKVVGMLRISSHIFYPLTLLFKKLPLFKYIKTKKETFFVKREEIKILVERITEEGILEEQEQEAIHSVFSFTTTKVQDVITHVSKVKRVMYSDTEDRIKEISMKSGYTRFPVFKGSQLVGIINIFDLFFVGGDWHNHIRPIRRIGLQQHIDKIFENMKENKETMAAVVDDKGHMLGIVTTMDIMKKITFLMAE